METLAGSPERSSFGCRGAPLVRRANRLLLDCLPTRTRAWLRARRSALAVAAGERLVPEKELERKYEAALRFLAHRHGAAALGDYLEFGVFHGASLACMHRALEAGGFERVRLFGFDSFAGLPAAADTEDDQTFHAGQFTADERTVAGPRRPVRTRARCGRRKARSPVPL
jgi:hypothetical protein